MTVLDCALGDDGAGSRDAEGGVVGAVAEAFQDMDALLYSELGDRCGCCCVWRLLSLSLETASVLDASSH